METTLVNHHQLDEVIARVNMIYDCVLKIGEQIKIAKHVECDVPLTKEEADVRGWLYADQVCEHLQISLRKLQRFQHDRVIEFTRIGRTPRFHPHAIYFLMKNNIVRLDPRIVDNFRVNFISEDDE